MSCGHWYVMLGDGVGDYKQIGASLQKQRPQSLFCRITVKQSTAAEPGMKWIFHLETDFRPSQVFSHCFRDPSPILCGTCLFLMLDVMMLPVQRKLQWAKEQLVPIGQSLMTQCVGVILINTQTEIIKTCQGIWLLSYLLILMIIEYLCQLRRL